MYVFDSWSFALFSANLHRYLPKVSWKEHQGLYKKWTNHHRSERSSKQVYDKTIDSAIALACKAPSILTLFHLGDHLDWPVLLGQRGINFNVLLDREVYQGGRPVFDRLIHALGSHGHTPELLFSDDPHLLLKIRTRKALGQHLLCFADGASGTNNVKKDQRISIPFLEGKIWLKKGIPVISSLFQMPVLVLTPENGHLQLARSITPGSGEDREDFVVRCLGELYSALEKITKKSPHLWECWGYLHRNGMLGKISDNQFVADEDVLIQLSWNNRKIWFDRVNYAGSLV